MSQTLLTFHQIADSFRRFGIQDDTRHIIAIKVGGDAEQVQSHLLQHIEGTAVPLSDETVAEICDPAKVKKVYKIDLGQGEVARREAEAVVLGMMALKGS